MTSDRVIGGNCRTYARVETFDHAGFMDAVAAGRTFVTNGPMLELTVDGELPGAEISLDGSGPHTVKAEVVCHTERSIEVLEIVLDGAVVHRVEVPAGKKVSKLSAEVSIERSGWLAARAGPREQRIGRGDRILPAAHTSPVYVTVDGEKPADAESAAYLMARTEAAVRWAREQAMWTSKDVEENVVETLQRARATFSEVIERAER